MPEPQTAPRPLRVLLADDSVLLREGVRSLLEDEGVQVVAAVGDGDQLLQAVAADPPDLAIVDVRMPPTHTNEGLVAALRITREHPGVGVLMLSQYVAREYASELLGTESPGIGYLLKDRITEIDGFLAAVRRVAAGGTVIDPAVVRSLLRAPEQQRLVARLTPREVEVLEAMAEGLSNRGIGERLFISQSTVEKAITAIFDKLELTGEDGTSRRVLAVLRYLEDADGA
ncbi:MULTISPECIES: response regulator transcription factor [Brachybacterium]|uniref:Response regulator n=1 Tax=Brachybacterium rhamnosum TaxID=173361 RepID=A0ABW4Q0H4_9MICO|nr:response regulator transcription factor [Brachybacterium squillarum]MCW1804492.1 response regulator transcription factor [Brachybacterium squillarum]